MNVLGICGSPRRSGNTEILLDKALSGAASNGAGTEKVILNDLKFSPCQECEDIRDDGSCIIEDDMRVVYEKIERTDALILASPVFFGSLSAQTKMMIDRFQCFWRAKYVLKNIKASPHEKKGAFISVSAGAKEEFFRNARSIVKNFFATVGVSYSDEVFCPGVENKSDILKYPAFLEKSFEIGRRLT